MLKYISVKFSQINKTNPPHTLFLNYNSLTGDPEEMHYAILQ